MRNRHLKTIWQLLWGAIATSLLYACANMASPNGGPYDEQPPKFVSSTPAPGQLNYKGKKVEILFDELIQVDKPTENVIITPPQAMQPVIRANGRRVIVELEDTLRDNTTYTIDFTNSIADNNEKNIFENFSFAFSTGDQIDTLEISGVLLDAATLEPMPGITIGVHTDLADSAFTTIPFVRTSRTNDRGAFTIRNMAPGTYRIYAVEDVMRTYKYSQPGQQIAFGDSLIVPTFELITRQDTTWKDSLTIDTIKTVPYTHFMPDDIALRLFKEKAERQYMLRPERTDAKVLTLRFNASVDTLPALTPVNFTPSEASWYYLQAEDERKTLKYWLTDSLVWLQDTLSLSVDYLKNDSLNQLQPQTDTVNFVMRHRAKAEPKKKKKQGDEPDPIEFLGMNLSPGGTIEMTDTLSITFMEPVADLDSSLFRLERMVDSTWTAVNFRFFPDTTNSLRYFILRPWQYAEEYRLEADSATVFSVYGKWNNTVSHAFKLKKEDEYGHLFINLIGVDTTAFVELLNSSDMPVRKAKVKEGGALFMDLRPDKYYARLTVDLNGNGKWDTGDYAEKRQPELVIYCPKQFQIMQNWQVEETWDVTAVPMKRQKPLEITKNKPKEITKKKRDYRNEGKASSSSNPNSFGGLRF